MKKTLVILMAVLMLAALTACGSTASTDEEQTPAIVFSDFQIVQDYEGKDCIAVKFDYTNNNDDSQSAYIDMPVTAFQDNIELDSFAIVDMDAEWEEWENNYQMEVKPGTTATCCQVFVLRNESPVEAIAEPLFGGDQITATYNLE